MEEANLVIIGAGIYGLTCAATYHRLHPSAGIVILDLSTSIGGPWAPDRIFPGLNTNNLLGMYEHPDFPMDDERFAVKKGEHIPAEKMLQYLKAFVEWSKIENFLRLGTRVEVIEKEGENWRISYRSLNKGKELKLLTQKLIIAIGNTNKPFMPSYPTSQSFEPPVIHSKDFPLNFSGIVKPNNHTLVIGSGKSAWDVSYACATQPSATVTILIRPSSHGPIWMTPSHVTPLTLWLEKLVFTRFFGFMSPCPWAETSGVEGWLRSFFQGTWLGRKITDVFWNTLGEDAIALSKLDEHPETKKLRPWRGAFEVGTALSIHNYPTSFYDLVREGRVKIVFDEVKSLEEGRKVVLKSGETMQVDAVVCATGWQKGNTSTFKPEDLATILGMPHNHPLDSTEKALIKSTEADLLQQYPYLKERDTSRTHHIDPSLRYTEDQETDQKQQPYRLHRFIIPPSMLESRSIAFAGALSCLGNFSCAYIQSLWITSYLDGSRALPSSTPTEIRHEMYRDTQYCVLRGEMSYGRMLPDLVFDSLPYFDMLLRDLGLRGKRKGGVLGVRECVKSYGPEDYRGLVEEWEGRAGKERKKDV